MTANTPLEKNITAAILKRLNSMPGCRAKKHHGSMYGSSELDIYGCYLGHAFFLEVKRPGGKPTERQESDIRAWAAVGAIVGCVYSADAAQALITGAISPPQPGV
jgi:hypothetical protein